jgi:septum formation protein
MTASSKPPGLVLASTSPYRREQLARMGLKFVAVTPKFDETHIHNGDPAALALALARGKAMSVAADFANAIVIGSDQIVWCDGRVLGKPGTKERAWQELCALRGRRHEFYMGLFLFHTEKKAAQEFIVKGSARLRADLTEEELRQYVEIDNPVDCAGSAKTEGPGLMLFERLDCEDWTAIIGLPVIALTTALRLWHYPVFSK